MCSCSHVKVCPVRCLDGEQGASKRRLMECPLQFSETKAKPPLVADLFCYKDYVDILVLLAWSGKIIVAFDFRKLP